MVSYKTGLSKFKKTEILPTIFSDHNGIQLEINNSREAGNFTVMWEINILLNNQWVTEEIKKETKNILKQTKMET